MTAVPFDILLVDDEPPIGELLTRVARQEFPQAHFINTQSAQQTLDYLDQQPTQFPRLVLLDIDLHQSRSGLELLVDLRQRFDGQVPIIMLSVLRDEDKVQQAYEQGATAYTCKPEDLSGWQQYVRGLRDYWYYAAQLPPNN